MILRSQADAWAKSVPFRNSTFSRATQRHYDNLSLILSLTPCPCPKTRRGQRALLICSPHV